MKLGKSVCNIVIDKLWFGLWCPTDNNLEVSILVKVIINEKIRNVIDGVIDEIAYYDIRKINK